MGVGGWLIAAGFLTIVGTVVGFPFLDQYSGCGWNPVCAANRALLWSLLVLLIGPVLIVGGLVALLKSPKKAGDLFVSAGRGGYGVARVGLGLAGRGVTTVALAKERRKFVRTVVGRRRR